MALCEDGDIDVKDAPPGELMSVEPPADPLTATPAWETSEIVPAISAWEVQDDATTAPPTTTTTATGNTTPDPEMRGNDRYPTVSKQRPKQYKRPTPSKFCHVCGRKTATVPVAICRRIREGLCRKVVCRCCFEKYGWDLREMETGNWICTHCRGACVPRAQCNIYGRTNYKRHLRLRRRRVGKELLKMAKDSLQER